MTCKGVLSSLSDYLEGDAGEKVCMEIEEHLDGCERCRMHVDTMRLIVTLYKRWRSEPIPDDVSMRLKRAFAETLQCSPRPRPETKTSRPRKAKSIKVKREPGPSSTKKK